MKKLIVIFFSAALGISFLFIGFGSYFGQSHIIKVGDIKITSEEFSRKFENYKAENQLNNLSEEENIYSKIQFVNQYVNQLLFEEYLNNKIDLSDKSKKVILKKSFNNNEMFNNLDEASLQNYLKAISSDINKDIFNNSLDVQELVNIDIKDEILKEKELSIFEIKNTSTEINNSLESEYIENYKLYKIRIIKYNLEDYLENEVINDKLIDNFYKENITKYTEEDSYTYEQIISEKILNENFENLKKNKELQYKLFENVDANLILPQIKNQLENIKIKESGGPIEIGNRFFYIKKIDFQKSYIKDLKEVRKDIKNTIIQSEIDEIDTSIINESLESYSNENIFYSNSFNFIENIPQEFQFINFNNFEDQIIENNFLFDYKVEEIKIDDLQVSFKNEFLLSYSIYKKNIDKSHNEEELINMGNVKVNYFTDSLTIKGFFISEDELENIVTIKPSELLKIVLPNEVIYLKQKNEGKIDSTNIKQNIINQIYSDIINRLKLDIEIDVNNQQLLQL